MLEPRSETRVDVLQETCFLLQHEVVRLATIVREQAEQIATLEGRELTQAELELLGGRVVELPPPVSPKTGSDRSRPPAEPAPLPARGHGPRPQPSLPLTERHRELAEDQRTCDVCQGEMSEMSGVSEDSEEITVVERSYQLVLHRRKKYRCRCNANVVTAPAPPRLIPGGRYSTAFAVSVAVDKYSEHLPLQRQVIRMARTGLDVSTTTLFDQIAALAEVLSPTAAALRTKLLEGPVLHVDETGWLLAPNGQKIGRQRHRKKRFTATVWGLCSENAAYYALLDSKSTEAGRSLLEHYRGIVVADGYQVYETLARSDEAGDPARFTLVNCWAHVFRRFRKLEEHDSRVRPVLGWIRQLYEIDREVPGPFPGDESACQQRLRLREEKSVPILEAIRKWSFEQGGLRRSDFGKAIHYMLKRWERLTRFVEDGRIPLDNNRVERALRGPVLGRKNHYCSRSERGARTTAILYSLIETAKLNGVDPAAYLLQAAEAALAEPGTVTLP